MRTRLVLQHLTLGALVVAAAFTLAVQVSLAQLPAEVDSTGYEHNKFGVMPEELMRNFGSFIVSFDSADDDNGDGEPDMWGIPVWVAHEVKQFDGQCIDTGGRPNWFTDRRLALQRIAPRDATYVYSRAWRKLHPDWYVRGHLAMKFLAERMGPDGARNTFTLLNAVPQRQSFNAGPWLELEFLTGAYAQRYGAVWIITGPIIIDNQPSGWIGQGKEVRAAIPDALFKIVVKNAASGEVPDVLAFIYPQVGAGYTVDESPTPELFLASVDEIEELTGLEFLSNLSPTIQDRVESEVARTLWEVSSSDFVRACSK